jgi:integrase
MRDEMSDDTIIEVVDLVPVEPSTELTKVDAATEVTLPGDRLDAVRDAVTNARSERTRKEYAKQFAKFETWCACHGRASIPAATVTIAAYITALQDGSAGADGSGVKDGAEPKPLFPSSIEVSLSAIIIANRRAGHQIDRKSDALTEAIKGSKTKAGQQHGKTRRVRPIKAEDLRDILRLGNAPDLVTVRDNAILGIGFAAALRRSEIATLDYGKRGDGDGYVELTDEGVKVTLLKSKASQSDAVELAIPCKSIPTVCEAIEDWVVAAGLEPGAPMFQGLAGKGRATLTGKRISDRKVARVIKARVHARAKSHHKTAADADEIVKTFSGHSLRAGFIASAAEKNIPV